MMQRKPVRAAHRDMPGSIGQRLRRVVEATVAASLSACAGAAATTVAPLGSDGQSGAPGSAVAGGSLAAGSGNMADEEQAGWERVMCDASLLTTVPPSFSQPVDYFAIMQNFGRGYYPQVKEAFTARVSEMGKACAGASDQAACMTALAALIHPDPACQSMGLCNSYTVLTAGDRVERQDNAQDLIAWLGEVDTPSDALLISMLQGHDLGCAERPRPSKSGLEVRDNGDGYSVRSYYDVCSAWEYLARINVHRDGSTSDEMLMQLARSGCSVGRRPEGLCQVATTRAATPLGRFFADIAQLEGASIYAFRRLARELAALGAPAALRISASRSAEDEVRHTVLTSKLALRLGALPVLPKIAAPSLRGAFAIALENAVEGCVRETFGALVAHHQARLAHDPSMLSTLRIIAADELRHAELSWQVAGWLEPKLSESERTALAHARRRAVEQLAQEVENETLAEHERARIGLPNGRTQLRLLDGMSGALGLC